MITKMWSQRRTLWIVIGAGIVILTLWSWLMTGWERHQPAVPDETTSSMNRKAGPERRSVQASPKAPSQDTGPAQAYAMVAPLKQQLIGVKTMVVEKRLMETTIRAVGRVDYDEQRIAHVNLRISGWVEDLFVDYTGQVVRKGQPLFTLYSPDLVATQDEYLLALRARDKVKDSPIPEVLQQADQMVEATRDRLRLWTLTDTQINELARRGKAKTYVTIYSPIRGYVIDKQVFKGMFVQPDMRLYTIADLSTVWVNAEIYEYEVPFVGVGQMATVTFASYPGEQFHGRVSYIYPYLNKDARTVKVRLDLPNPDIRIKPDMYGDVLVNVDRGNKVAIPEQAVLDSGMRTLVFVVRGEGLFEPRAVKLGPRIGSYYEVHEGVTEGDRVVTSGNFLIDSESKLMAATNMMGALGMGGIRMEQAQMGEMDMGGMDMGTPKAQKAKSATGAKLEKKTGGLTLVVSTEPASPRIGENQIRVKLTDETGKLMSAAKVLLTYTMPMPGMMPATIPMALGKDGVFEAKANLGMGGQWDLTITVQRPGQAEIKETFSVTAGGAGMSGMPGM
ncbi:MAG: efflux RND transporter periplasmic adaptor subunit [Nitrospira sp. CR1.3]|nr:efflux RND transporter periplasmic adaptor subunit [Nitrospira sp. CR1.3]